MNDGTTFGCPGMCRPKNLMNGAALPMRSPPGVVGTITVSVLPRKWSSREVWATTGVASARTTAVTARRSGPGPTIASSFSCPPLHADGRLVVNRPGPPGRMDRGPAGAAFGNKNKPAGSRCDPSELRALNNRLARVCCFYQNHHIHPARVRAVRGAEVHVERVHVEPSAAVLQ